MVRAEDSQVKYTHPGTDRSGLLCSITSCNHCRHFVLLGPRMSDLSMFVSISDFHNVGFRVIKCCDRQEDEVPKPSSAH